MSKDLIDNFKAIHALVGGAITQKADGEIVYHDGQTPPTEEAIQAKLAELQADYDSKQYQRDRASRYPSTAEQLDLLYHQGFEGWKTEIKKVKDQFPKPAE